jgi:hypothetical protein
LDHDNRTRHLCSAGELLTNRQRKHWWLANGPVQGCQIFLGPNIPKREKYTKWPKTIPSGHTLYQMAVKYSKWS